MDIGALNSGTTFSFKNNSFKNFLKCFALFSESFSLVAVSSLFCEAILGLS